MIKAAKYTYGGINQDMSRSKHDPSLYFEAQHIRIISEDSQTSGSVTNEKGTKIVFTIPDIVINNALKTLTYLNKVIRYENIEIDNLTYDVNNAVIVGHVVTKDSVILITNSGNTDCVWEIKDIYNENDSYDIELLYIRDLNISLDNPIQMIYNYENEKNEKIYWVDGKNQLRFLNLRHSIKNGDKENLIDLDSDLINTVGNIQQSQPIITGSSNGGVHTAGLIQYAYNLYKVNLSQTTLSPLTPLYPLSKNGVTEGGNVNEVVGAIPIIQIDNIDKSYTNIRVYALKYNSLNEIPKISIISDRSIPENGSLTIYDDGNVISDISLEELTFLGSDPVIPKHIETKDNHLFKFNITENYYTLKDLDVRAYSFNGSGISNVWETNGVLLNGVPRLPYTRIPADYTLRKTHDAINPGYDFYKFQKDGVTLGGEGKYLKYELVASSVYNKNNQYFKAREIYRLSIEFTNKAGQKTLPEWIADIQAPDNNLNNLYNTLSVTLKPEFYTYINSLPEDQRPIGYRVLRANREITDRTILCQGFINPMIANKIFNDKHSLATINNTPSLLDDQQIIKYPSLVRKYVDETPLLANQHGTPLANRSRTDTSDNSFSNNNGTSEGFKTASRKDFRGQLFQYNKMMQMYSPDVIFNNVQPDNTHKLRIKGVMGESAIESSVREVNYITQITGHNARIRNGISPFKPTAIVTRILGSPDVAIGRDGIFAPPANDIVANYHQFYREFLGTYQPGQNNEYNIYGTPEIKTLGQGVSAYNNDSKYRYSHDYSTILQDSGEDSRDRSNPTGRGYNSYSIAAITFVEGQEQFQNDSVQRRSIEALYNQNGFTNPNSIIISELVKPESYKYIGNIYGGNNYESKRRTSYIPIGNYTDINTSSITIDSPGDTFVSNFIFTKASKAPITIASPGVNQLTEIVNFKVETTVDLKNRNDISNNSWDSVFQPEYNDYQKYNTIYSQKEHILKRRNVDANFKEVNEFGNTIIASKKKIAGELIDSWTDTLVNETLDLDGKYGSINGTTNFKDQIFTFQDKAVAALSINPRIQTQGSDGLSLELGTGSVLQDYQYVTTKSGSVNKWGIVQGSRGVYYYDSLNKAMYRFPDMVDVSLSDTKGLRNWFHNNHDYNKLMLDNPLIGNGVLLGSDSYNKDIYLTLNLKDPVTRVFNEKLDQFIDIKKYNPKRYIDSSHKFFGIEDNQNIERHNSGIYNQYYGRNESSWITLMINPESDVDCVFNNLIYKSELYLNDIDQPNETLTHIQAFNEFQDSGLVPLIIKDNLRRKFRDWKAFIPRDGRDRIRNPWIFLKLELVNNNNYKLVLHDINILYSV